MLSLTAVGLLSIASASVASGGPSATPKFTATPLAQVDFAEGVKSSTARLAQTDPSLLGRTDSAPVNVVVKYDYDSTATYAGGVQGLAATSPKTTGKELKNNKKAVDDYEGYLKGREDKINRDVTSKVRGANVRDSFKTVYGGVAMTVPANAIADLLKVDGVVAIQKDELNQPLTDASPTFIGATSAWRSLGGSTKAGEGVIVGVLDTGIWPEHDSFNDNGIGHPGGTYGCEFGSGLDPQLGAPYACDDKLIGAYAFTDTYMAVIGALPGEYCNNVTDECSARDANGHGTHTSSTAAGSAVAHAVLLGVDRGPISGIAPGAHLIQYRVCLNQGCFGSDSVAAVEQAILDGVDVLNFSISGGGNAYTDPVELAFLDAYEAGIIVNASAGNSGPGAGTAAHAGPWVTTVGASTSDRHFLSTLKLTAADGAVFEQEGVTITAGVTGKDVVLATAVGSSELCDTPATPALASGKVVVCKRGVNARVDKGYRMSLAGAAGMILYNPLKSDLESDNHWLPAIHLEGPLSGPHPLITFLSSHTGVKATWASGTAKPVLGDVMAAFSSRGPLGDFIKPDVTSVGIQVLAGNTPTPLSTDAGPPGQLYQAIAGTSMSSPHAAGVSALVKAAHPDWTPGQIKSALMTSSVQSVVKEDGVTPADPFDRGAGSIRANRAIASPITFDVSAAEYIASAGSPLGRINLNLPSINAPTMSGEIRTERTLKNVTDDELEYRVETSAPEGATITVKPSSFELREGRSKTLKITISAPGLANGQYFGQITLVPGGGHGHNDNNGNDNNGGHGNNGNNDNNGNNGNNGNNDKRRGENRNADSVIPVAFNRRQGVVTLSHTCAPTTFRRSVLTSCSVQAQNNSSSAAAVTVAVSGDRKLTYSSVTGPAGTRSDSSGFTWSGTLSPALAPTIVAVNKTPGGSPAGYLPLSAFGVPPIAGASDESIHTFDLASSFRYGSEPYTRISMVSNGYAVVGGGSAADVDYVPLMPNAARPNNVLAGYWTDLDPSGGGAMRAATLTGGGQTWTVLDWENVPLFGEPGQTQSFQIWIERSATAEHITYTYGPVTGTGSGDLLVGAENRDGSSAKTTAGPPAEDDEYTVVTAPPAPGGTATFTYKVGSKSTGTFSSIATLTSDLTPGTTQVPVTLTITK